MYVAVIAGHIPNDSKVSKVPFFKCVFQFVPSFGLHLCTLDHEDVLVMNYKALLSYHQTLSLAR